MKAPGSICRTLLVLSLLCLPAGPALAKKDSAKQKEIRKLLVLTGTQQMADQMTKQILANLRSGHPDLPESFWKKMASIARSTSFMDQMVAIYDRHLDRKVIQAAITFFSSPAGKTMVAAQPAITMESMQVGQSWGQQLAMKISKEIEKQRTKKGKKGK